MGKEHTSKGGISDHFQFQHNAVFTLYGCHEQHFIFIFTGQEMTDSISRVSRLILPPDTTVKNRFFFFFFNIH